MGEGEREGGGDLKEVNEEHGQLRKRRGDVPPSIEGGQGQTVKWEGQAG